MAKIVRPATNVMSFASEAIGTERTIFGSNTQSDDLLTNLNALFKRGWGIVGTNDLPTKQDFNAMGFTLGQLLAYVFQTGVIEWAEEQEYHEDSIVNFGGTLYKSLQNDNEGNTPNTSPAWWASVGDVADGSVTRAKLAPGALSLVPNFQTTNYTLALTDEFKHIIMTSGSALQLQIPTNATVALPLGTTVLIERGGAGAVTIVAPAGGNVYNAAPSLTIGKQRGVCILTKIATNDWLAVFIPQGTAAFLDSVDDDTFATASSTTVPTSESVKAYVDAGAWPGVYTGTSAGNTNFPIGTSLVVAVAVDYNRNSTVNITLAAGNARFEVGGAGASVAGTWRARGTAPNVLHAERVA